MNAKLYKYDMASEGYVTQTGTLSVPCPPIFFDANKERGYIAELKKNAIFSGIEPLFLIQKFVNVVSHNGAKKLKRQWESFTKTNPKAHNTGESSSARSSDAKSYHLGVWRRYSKKTEVTVDTRECEDGPQKTQCLNFLWTVKTEIAPDIRRLLQRYTKKEWEEKKR
jgi:hypothetical protein